VPGRGKGGRQRKLRREKDGDYFYKNYWGEYDRVTYECADRIRLEGNETRKVRKNRI